MITDRSCGHIDYGYLSLLCKPNQLIVHSLENQGSPAQD